MSEPVSLPASCPLCGGPVWLELSPPEPDTRIETWNCPYCQRTNETKIDGKILWIARRYGDSTQPAKH